MISTTSTKEKAARLKSLGADYVINYNEVSDWGEKAKTITNSEGVDFVVEVGGPNTIAQSLTAIRPEGVISIVGYLGGLHTEREPSYLGVLQSACTVRGVLVGSRTQFEDMIQCIEANDIQPVTDSQVFELHGLRDAYQYLWDQKHFGKVTVKISE